MKLTNLLTSVCLFSLISVPMFSAAAFADGNAAKGKPLYDNLCVTCHGAAGAGDGPIALSLPPEMKPRNLQEGKMKFAVDDAKFIELIKKGGAAVGLNPLMPAQSQLSDEEIKNVIAYVHTLKK